MRLRDLNIGTQLRIGLGAIMIFVGILGVLAYFQADQLWQGTKNLYEHPFTVRIAIGELNADVLNMENGVKDLLVTNSDIERQSIIKDINDRDADAAKRFVKIDEAYLGHKIDVVTARYAFIQWKSICDENIQLIRDGNIAEVKNRIKSDGSSDLQVKKVLGSIKTISDFALDKGKSFNEEAKSNLNSLKLQLTIVLVIILVLVTIISIFLLKSIKEPLTDITSITEEYMQGNMGARVNYYSGNEFGILASSFNKLADTVEMELKNRESVARIAEVLLGQDELHSFCSELLKALIQQTRSQIGAIYLLNDRNDSFEHYESIGLESTSRVSFSAADNSGEFGVALVTREIQRITDIPADTHFIFSTVSGEMTPKEIITIPVIASQNGVVAVVSLASIHNYSEVEIRLINDVWKILTSRLNGVLAFKKIHTFSNLLEQQNNELEAQKKEMQYQRDELSEQNIELELQKNQLDESSRLKSTFLSNMSHELRTPLNSVIALSSVLNRRLKDAIPEEEYRYLDVIERNGKMLLELINDILDLSRIEAGKEEIILSRFSVREIVADVVSMVEQQAQEKGINLITSVSEDLSPIRSDFFKCRHILQNIISNAVKFTDKGSVTINASQLDDTIQIFVKDTGIGIADDKIKYIFDEFRQADESTTRSYGGSGLGLAIAHKYASLLHGTISVDSTLGAGSVFKITLPLSIERSNNTEQKIAGIEKHANTYNLSTLTPISNGEGKTILIVEDSEPAIIQLTDILTTQGYNIRVAHNGKEAIEQIEMVIPDAMILDLMMPEVDGFEVLRSVRGSEKTSQLPVIILTAKHVTQQELNFLTGNHVHQLIQKGDINKHELLTAIGKMVTSAIPPEIKPKRRTASITTITGKPVILVVEDNPDNMTTVKALLQDYYEIIEAVDGKMGVEKAIEYLPNLMLMDISLPVMDGIKALGVIRNEEKIRHIPVVALTARAMKGNREEILACGFDSYISKPIDEEILLKTIAEMINGHE